MKMDFISLSRRAILDRLHERVRGLSSPRKANDAHGRQVWMRRADWPADFAAAAKKIAGIRDSYPDMVSRSGGPSDRKVAIPTVIPTIQTLADGELAVCACYFNPAKYRRRLVNFHRWHAAAKSQGADIHLIEATMDGQFELPADLPNVKRVQLKSILWHKERLLNILIKSLPDKYNRVAWVDADLLFDNPDWVADTHAKLSEFAVCQCFEFAYWLDVNDVPIRWWNDDTVALPSVAKGYVGGPVLHRLHPGFAWAGRRDWLEEVGLWDLHITGSGDSVMAIAFLGKETNLHVFLCGEGMKESANQWAMKIRPHSRDRIGCVSGNVRHLWHGSRKDRGYDDRILRTKLADYNPSRDLAVDSATGCYEWSAAAPQSLKDGVREYFWERKEDG